MTNESETRFLLTKVLATLGPASDSLETITRLIEVGARAFRINFSHGSLADHERTFESIRAASERIGVHVGVLGDLPGPKIRVGQVVEGGVRLETGARVEFQQQAVVAGSPGSLRSGAVVFSSSYPGFVEEVQPGQPVLLDDGNVRLLCLERAEDGETRLICRVVSGGLVTSNKGINLPETELSVPALSERDHGFVEFAVRKGFDYLALSFVRSAEDVRRLKDRLRQLGAESSPAGEQHRGSVTADGGTFDSIPVISKIEKPQALQDIEAIVEESDAILVARGDLGVEMDLAEVPVAQKRIIRLCLDHGKPVIVATQMLERMIESPTPTRAEVSDVANAIFDGADVVMLSGETAVGRWPVEAVRMMNRIARHANAYLQTLPVSFSPPRKLQESRSQPAALAHGVGTIVRDMEAKLVVLWSQLDRGALFLSQNRLSRPIVAFSSNPRALRIMSILYGVTPHFMEAPRSTAAFFAEADKILLENNWVERGDPVVFVFREPVDRAGLTNSVRVHRVGETGDA